LLQVTTSIEEGSWLLKTRQKSISLADRSEFGWLVVTKYDANKLGEDSDNKRKIEKVEKAAEKAALQCNERETLYQPCMGREDKAPHFQGRRLMANLQSIMGLQ